METDGEQIKTILESVEPANPFVLFKLTEDVLAYMKNQGFDIDELKGKTYSSERALADELSEKGMDEQQVKTILENVEPVNSFVRFRLTDESLQGVKEALEYANVQPEATITELLKKLEKLKDQPYTSEWEFVEALNAEIGEEDTIRWQGTILGNVNRVDPFAVFTLTEDAPTYMESKGIDPSLIDVDKTYTSEGDLKNELRSIEGTDETLIKEILNNYIKPAEGYEFKITEGVLEQLTAEGAPNVLTDALRALVGISYKSEYEFRNILIDILKDLTEIEEEDRNIYENKTVKHSARNLEPPEKGDIDGNGVPELADALIALKILTEIDIIQTDPIKRYADEHGKIGLEQAIYIMRYLAN